MELYRPIDILRKYPEIKKVWTANDLGQLLHMGFVSGKKLSRGCLLDVPDVLHIFTLVKKKCDT